MHPKIRERREQVRRDKFRAALFDQMFPNVMAKEPPKSAEIIDPNKKGRD